jgi:hypothetical protein
MPTRSLMGPNSVQAQPQPPQEDKLGGLKKTIAIGTGVVAGSIAMHGLMKYRNQDAMRLVKKLRGKLANKPKSDMRKAAASGRYGLSGVIKHEEQRVGDTRYAVKPFDAATLKTSQGREYQIAKGMPLYSEKLRAPDFRAGGPYPHSHTRGGGPMSKSGKFLKIPMTKDGRPVEKGGELVEKRIGQEIQTGNPNRPGYVAPEEQWKNYRTQKYVHAQRKAVIPHAWKTPDGLLKPEAREVISERRAALVDKNRPFASEANRAAKEKFRNMREAKIKRATKEENLERVLKVIREFSVTTSANRGSAGKFESAEEDDGMHPKGMQEAYHKPVLKRAAQIAGGAAMGIGAYKAATSKVGKAIGGKASESINSLMKTVIEREGMKNAHEKIAARFVESSGSNYFRKKLMQKIDQRGYKPEYVDRVVQREAGYHADRVLRRHQQIKVASAAVKKAETAATNRGQPFTDEARAKAASDARKKWTPAMQSRGGKNSIRPTDPLYGPAHPSSAHGTQAQSTHGTSASRAQATKDELAVAKYKNQASQARNEADMTVRSAEAKRKAAEDRAAKAEADRALTGKKLENKSEHLNWAHEIISNQKKIAEGKIKIESKDPVIYGPDGAVADPKKRARAAASKYTKEASGAWGSPSSIPTREEAARIAHEHNARGAATGKPFKPKTAEMVRSEAVGGGDNLPNYKKQADDQFKAAKKLARDVWRGRQKIKNAREKTIRKEIRERKKGIHKTMDGTGNETGLDPGHSSSGKKPKGVLGQY